LRDDEFKSKKSVVGSIDSRCVVMNEPERGLPVAESSASLRLSIGAGCSTRPRSCNADDKDAVLISLPDGAGVGGLKMPGSCRCEWLCDEVELEYDDESSDSVSVSDAYA